jgi:predicted DNA-binding transcriptional regulator
LQGARHRLAVLKMDKNNLKILKILISKPDKYFDVSEITQDTGLSEKEVTEISVKLFDKGYIKPVSTSGKIISIRISPGGIENINKLSTKESSAHATKTKLFWWIMGIIGTIIAGLVVARLNGVWK